MATCPFEPAWLAAVNSAAETGDLTAVPDDAFVAGAAVVPACTSAAAADETAAVFEADASETAAELVGWHDWKKVVV